MECKHCNSSWNSATKSEICPFCGMSLTDIPMNMTISSALNQIIIERGKEILNDSKTVMSLIADYVTTSEKEKKMFRVAVQNGALKKAYTILDCAESAQKELLIKKLIQELQDEAFFSVENATFIVTMIMDGICPYKSESSEKVKECVCASDAINSTKETSVEDGAYEKTAEDCKFEEIVVKLLKLRKDKCEETNTETQQKIEEYYDQLFSLHTVVSRLLLYAAISTVGPDRFELADEEQYERIDSMYDIMFENLAERGDPWDQRNYAEYAQQKYEADKYLHWLAKSADQGEKFSIVDLVEYYYSRDMYEEAFDWIIKQSKCDDIHHVYDACCKLAWMYRTGSGVQKDEKLSNEWKAKAQMKLDEMKASIST